MMRRTSCVSKSDTLRFTIAQGSCAQTNAGCYCVSLQYENGNAESAQNLNAFYEAQTGMFYGHWAIFKVMCSVELSTPRLNSK